MPLFDQIPIITTGPSRLYIETPDQQYLVWNSAIEVWEPLAKAKWYECGEWIDISANRLCTKLIGHGGEYGARDVDG